MEKSVSCFRISIIDQGLKIKVLKNKRVPQNVVVKQDRRSRGEGKGSLAPPTFRLLMFFIINDSKKETEEMLSSKN